MKHKKKLKKKMKMKMMMKKNFNINIFLKKMKKMIIKKKLKKMNSENEDEKRVTIYDNIDYPFDFLKPPKESITNHVLLGYFYKILFHLISSQSSKIIQYLFDYPKKTI